MRDVRKELERGAEEALYLLVGAGVLGMQRARAKAHRDPLRHLGSLPAALPEPLAEPLRALCSLLGVPVRKR